MPYSPYGPHSIYFPRTPNPQPHTTLPTIMGFPFMGTRTLRAWLFSPVRIAPERRIPPAAPEARQHRGVEGLVLGFRVQGIEGLPLRTNQLQEGLGSTRNQWQLVSSAVAGTALPPAAFATPSKSAVLGTGVPPTAETLARRENESPSQHGMGLIAQETLTLKVPTIQGSGALVPYIVGVGPVSLRKALAPCEQRHLAEI